MPAVAAAADHRRVALPPPCGDLSGQGVPDRRVIVEAREQRPVPVRHSRIDGIVRVGKDQRHPLALAEELSLPEPDVRVSILENSEKGMVLRQGHRELDHALVEVRQVAAAASRLWLVGIGVGVGRVVIEPESGHPLPLPLSGRGAESDGLPAIRVLSHRREPLREQPPGAEVVPIVPEAVDANLAAFLPQLADRLLGDFVAKRDEIPRRPVAKLAFRFTQQVEAAVSGIGFHVVRQHQRPGPAVRPLADERHGSAGQPGQQAEQPLVEVVQAFLGRPAREGRAFLHLGIRAPEP